MNIPFINSSRQNLINFKYCFFIIVLGSLVYGNHLQNPFQFDTVAYVNNQHRLDNIEEQLNINFLKKQLSQRGLFQISVAFNAYLDGFRPLGYHLFNLIFHLINSLLLYFITFKAWVYFKLGRLHPKECEIRSISLLTAALFLLHPIQTESVVYIMSRSEVLAATFFLNAFLLFQLCLDRSRPTKTRLKIFACFLIPVAFILGFSVKQTVITLPMMLLLYFICGQSSDSLLIKILNKWKWVIGAIFLIGLFFLFQKLLTDESFLIGPSTAGQDIGRLNYMLTQPSVILFYYFKLFLFPINLNVDPDIQIITYWWSWKFWSGLVAIFGAIYFSYRIKETRFLFFLVLWFLIVISPSSSIITLNDLAAEHRVYLASYAYYAIVVILIYKLSHLVFPENSNKRNFLLLNVSILILIIFFLLTNQRNKIWTSEVMLWSDTLKKSPKKIRPMINLARAYTTVQNYDSAITYYEKVMALNPNIFATNFNLGNLYLKKGREKDAIRLLQTAAILGPYIPEVHGLLGEIYLQKKQIDLAQFHLKRAVEIKPNYAIAMKNLGIISYFYLKKYKKAIVYFSRSLSINPNQTDADNIRLLINQLKNSIINQEGSG